MTTPYRSWNNHRWLFRVRPYDLPHRRSSADDRSVHHRLDLVHLVGMGAGEGCALDRSSTRKNKRAVGIGGIVSR